MIVGAVLLCAYTQSRATPSDAHDIYIEDYRLHIECSGHGSPAVILDAGLGGSSLEWVFVVERLRRLTEVCTYDRAGYGGSDTGPLPRTSSRIVTELHHLLESAGIPPPYVLAGHSFGGYNMQLFARRYPALTAGLVLVDASHPDQVERFEAPPLNMVTAPNSRAGIVQFRDQPPANAALPPRVRLKVAEQAQRWKTRRTLSAELLSFRDSAAEVRAAPPLGAIPLVVLSRGRQDAAMTPRKQAFERLWLELQSELASSSTVAAHLLALHAGHQIHIEQPDLVAYGIAMLVTRARGGTLSPARYAGRDGHAFLLADVVWLKDELSVAAPVLAAAPLPACADACASRQNGAP
jgi:pimeloyl-ACP methyl ester carboxylesterase